jgi:hypothetical protein
MEDRYDLPSGKTPSGPERLQPGGHDPAGCGGKTPQTDLCERSSTRSGGMNLARRFNAGENLAGCPRRASDA